MSKLKSQLYIYSLGFVNYVLKSIFKKSSSGFERKKILVCHDFLLGDLIMVLDLVKSILKVNEDKDVYVCCKPAYASLLRLLIPEIIPVPVIFRSVESVRVLCSLGPFDEAFIPGNNKFSWVASAARSEKIIALDGWRRAIDNLPVTHLVGNESDNIRSLAEIFSSLLVLDSHSVSNISCSNIEISGEHANSALNNAGLRLQSKYAILHVGASNRVRFWPKEYWRELAFWIRDKGIEPVLTFGPGEDELISSINFDNEFTAMKSAVSLVDMAIIVYHSSFVCCLDSGVAHLSKFFGKTTFCLFGPGSDIAFGGGARNFHSVVCSEPIWCKNQNTLFGRSYPWLKRCGRNYDSCLQKDGGYSYCMKKLTVDLVQEKIMSVIESDINEFKS